MQPNRPDIDFVRRQYADLVLRLRAVTADAERKQAELDAMYGPPAQVAAETAAPADGEIRDDQIWLHDRWQTLTDTIRRTLAYVLGDGNGKSLKELCDHMGWKFGRASKSNIERMNDRIKLEMDGATCYPRLYFDDGVRCDWGGPGAKKKKSA